MRHLVTAVVLALAAPAAASIAAHATGLAATLGGAMATLPDPSTAALMFGGLGLVAAARRTRSKALAD